MRDALIAILLCGAAVATCESRTDDAPTPPPPPARMSSSDDAVGANGVEFRADTTSGEVQLSLPGGIESRIKLPGGLEADGELDLGGIGRYPGARLTEVKLNALGAETRARVQLGFSAPGSADTVADWYEKAFAASGRSVLRSGTTLSTTTGDGEPLVMALTDAGNGLASGRITIRDERPN